MAAQSLLHDKPFAMEPKVLEIEQKDIIWENLDIRSWNRSIRFVISMILTLVLFVSWMSLTMAATSMSNLEKVIIFFGGNPNSISQTAYGVINGMVPPTITALLMMLLPILLRQLLFIEGQMLESEVEMSLLNRYYVFLVINVFIGSMISNGVLDFLRKSGSLSMWNKVMTSTIPSAYIYFSTYILLQGWLGSSKEILQGTTFFLRYLRFWWSGGTPRAKREARELEQFEW
ncbi:phosphate metabolism protein 7, partial [Spiromyces aspiralis]